MSDTLITIIAIFLAAVLMFVFPLMAVSNSQDDISKVAVQSLVSEFVNTCATQGKITQDNYNNFLSKLNATGNSYDVQLEVQIMTTNPNKGTDEQLGENLYYSVFNNTILKEIETNQVYLLKKGGFIICTVKNTNTTIAAQIKNIVFSIVGKDNYTIAGSASALIVNSGK